MDIQSVSLKQHNCFMHW